MQNTTTIHSLHTVAYYPSLDAIPRLLEVCMNKARFPSTWHQIVTMAIQDCSRLTPIPKCTITLQTLSLSPEVNYYSRVSERSDSDRYNEINSLASQSRTGRVFMLSQRLTLHVERQGLPDDLETACPPFLRTATQLAVATGWVDLKAPNDSGVFSYIIGVNAPLANDSVRVLIATMVLHHQRPQLSKQQMEAFHTAIGRDAALAQRALKNMSGAQT